MFLLSRELMYSMHWEVWLWIGERPLKKVSDSTTQFNMLLRAYCTYCFGSMSDRWKHGSWFHGGSFTEYMEGHIWWGFKKSLQDGLKGFSLARRDWVVDLSWIWACIKIHCFSLGHIFGVIDLEKEAGGNYWGNYSYPKSVKTPETHHKTYKQGRDKLNMSTEVM